MATTFDPEKEIRRLRWKAQAALVSAGADIDNIRRAIECLQRDAAIYDLAKQENRDP